MTAEALRCKISKLPAAIVEALNHRMASSEASHLTLDWLLSLPETRIYLPKEYGKFADEDLLQEWKQTGFLEWATSGAIQSNSATFSAGVQNLVKVGLRSEYLLIHLTAMYAAILPHWDGNPRNPIAERLRSIGLFSNDICNLRKSELAGQRLALDREKFEFKRSEAQETSESPSVSQESAPPSNAPAPQTPAKPAQKSAPQSAPVARKEAPVSVPAPTATPTPSQIIARYPINR